ncbi:MAG: IS110 family transposase [Actinomycetota bacterium]|nr:IS110 family transposase [Actinomycetota bacterium]
MERIVDRCAGLEVHKASITACVRISNTGKDEEPHQQIRKFETTTRGLLQLRDWLASFEVELVGMEATGVYWKPVYYVLEDDFECWLLNAGHLKNVPGRKTDVKDAEWICQLVEHGLVRPSFGPPKQIRELRDLTRYRKTQIEDRSKEVQRLEKVLQDAGIKLSSVATRVLGASGRAMLDALVSGTTDPEVLADLAKARLRKKIPALREALEGCFSNHHAFMVGRILAHIDYLDESIGHLSAEIERVIAPFSEQVELLGTIPGVDRRTAEVLIAEIGTDMSRFPTHSHLASWAGMCPGNDESAGKRRSGKTTKGSKWLRTALTEAAHAAARTKGSYLRAQYAGIKGRRGSKKAAVAAGHSILVICYHILERKVPYEELGEEHFRKQQRCSTSEAYTRRLIRKLERLGHKVALEPLVGST